MVRRAGGEEDTGAALAHLCREYWYPLYAYARRRGSSPHDAQDLIQSFIAHLIEGPLLSRADPERGRFRSFMLGSLQNFLAKEHRREQAEKRGGGAEIVSLDEARDEQRFAVEPADEQTPESLFERSWAFALLDRVLVRVRVEYETAGRLALFEALQPYLAGKDGQAGYAALGEQLGLGENTVAVSIHRLRRRYGELLREEIAQTVDSPAEVEDEIAHLLSVVSS
jgi:RNA polymerase sigma-70 factor (ECF subfamily)